MAELIFVKDLPSDRQKDELVIPVGESYSEGGFLVPDVYVNGGIIKTWEKKPGLWASIQRLPYRLMVVISTWIHCRTIKMETWGYLKVDKRIKGFAEYLRDAKVLEESESDGR